METRFYGPEIGGENREWDLNDWKWDGDLFTAAPLNIESRQLFPVGSDNIPLQNRVPNGLSSSSDLEKRKRCVEVNDDEEANGSTLNLKLGRQQVFPVVDKQTKVNCVSVCQVECCEADLSNAKDYHRRHKVCDVHSKATSVLVGNVLQRFCQQCSRFHDLQEFDEGKRSCRRRLAGHNKRRRKKTHVQNTVSADDELSTNHLLISLLRLLLNLHCK
ncbi:squamosa promoter-binding-like protein 1 [Phtheirospermum japonicum]|uniref:Squamosa promoter-binding-like protein 1 n=1 Tax=Phtheirospermum japonicum TaxID=374723 RepID=A0A830B375_9LAMI|nr:squamosa promoter-binding-like protein 1 [Phtheirospermum japonicum]